MSSWRACTLSLTLACAAVAGALGAPAPAAAHDPALPPAARALLAQFQRIEGLEAHYREEKRMALLAAPLVSEGTVHYARPGKLARHQTRPEAVSVVLRDDHLVMGGAGGHHEVDLRRNPVVRMFVDSFLRVLAGDGPALLKVYALDYQPLPAGRWRLHLRPKLAPMDKMIEQIRIEGAGVILSTMEIVEIGGDTTVMTFSKVDPRRRYTAAERARLFRAP